MTAGAASQASFPQALVVSASAAAVAVVSASQ